VFLPVRTAVPGNVAGGTANAVHAFYRGRPGARGNCEQQRSGCCPGTDSRGKRSYAAGWSTACANSGLEWGHRKAPWHDRRRAIRGGIFPFAGSGSSCAAALLAGRRYVGIELGRVQRSTTSGSSCGEADGSGSSSRRDCWQRTQHREPGQLPRAGYCRATSQPRESCRPRFRSRSERAMRLRKP
jgi:hypothetical protein